MANLSNADIEYIQKIIIETIDNRLEVFKPQLKYNTTFTGKIVSYSNGIAKVKVNDSTYSCMCNKTVSVGNSVRVVAPNNNYKNLYVDEVI